MSYKIMNTLLPLGQRDKMFMGTLDALMIGENLNESPLAEWGRAALKAGRWWYGCEKAKNQEECIERRINKFIDLYHSIDENGYVGSPISVFFDDGGQVHVYDGFHRLAIMKYLNMRIKVNCVISTHDANPARRGDFPLVKAMIKLNSGKNLYQPCTDSRLKDFKVWRHDSVKRLNLILEHIKGETVLDIGCSEGYFSRELAKRDFAVTALDTDKRRMAITRYLATINSLELGYHVGSWQDYLKNLEEGTCFDNVLFLSVFHHDMLKLGPTKAFASLQAFRGRAKRLFFECPPKSSEVKWLSEKKKKAWAMSEDVFRRRIEVNTGMRTKAVWHGIRPIFVLETPQG